MTKDAADVAETLVLLHPSPLMVGEVIDDEDETFEEALSSVIMSEWDDYHSSYYTNNLESL